MSTPKSAGLRARAWPPTTGAIFCDRAPFRAGRPIARRSPGWHLRPLSILNILDHLDVASLGEATAGYVHAVVEATKLAFADRDRWVTDPAFLRAPTDRLLDRAYGALRARQIDMRRAGRYAPPGSPRATRCSWPPWTGRATPWP